MRKQREKERASEDVKKVKEREEKLEPFIASGGYLMEEDGEEEKEENREEEDSFILKTLIVRNICQTSVI
jgi:hypothetical protein